MTLMIRDRICNRIVFGDFILRERAGMGNRFLFPFFFDRGYLSQLRAYQFSPHQAQAQHPPDFSDESQPPYAAAAAPSILDPHPPRRRISRPSLPPSLPPGASMDCPKRGGAVVGLLDDPLVEILSRVPVKSLCRFKCVSKAWRDLIADPLHRRKLPQTLEGFFCGLRYVDGEDGYGGDGCCGGGGGGHWLDSVFIDLVGRSGAPLVDPSFSFLPEKLPGIKQVRILHSCNGLLLLRHGPLPYNYTHTPGYVVCNPATQEWVAVPSSGWIYSGPPEGEDEEDDDREIGEDTYLIFDPAVSSHFRLLQFLAKASSMNEVGLRTYSSETGVWTDRSAERLQQGGESPQLGSFESILSSLGSAFVNGMLHFIVGHFQKDQELIVAVDWEGKARRFISWPQSHTCSGFGPAFVGQSQGHLYCISEQIQGNSTQITIWVLEDYDKEEWVMKHSVSSLQLFGSIRWLANFDYTVVAIHPDRNLIFISHRGQKLISYNMDSKEVHALSTVREDYGITPYVPYFSESPLLSNKH
ncbi:F-box protein [Panicum miliaceum]|uniref:F-box protein n=1 Tax=Panicum miliaceum TaxID=4540 RepID=A0A3L6T6I4_PANMI|nr:F-box protein [Panicum miliaceum]